ncbi:MAG: glycoside hydrolase family 3 N-terminal domain-containing protein, partial [Bacteroidota bacterium]|nr:glycoside hydrolase family 3 N-terminal domain-containing protein [Bacteroidota bacterium]MDP4194805.1 glycoside hydrolase family 3 N-terminal domain-containing protein [Bacteroidota bacterium]
SKMTLDEKIGQMLQVDSDALDTPEDIKTYCIGSILSGGNSEIEDVSPQGWANFYDKLQSYAVQTRLKIPIIYGIDAVHGHNNVKGAVIFPHNIGLGCTNNPSLVEKACKVIAEEIAGTGIDWTFAPCVAVPQNERWGRTYEGFGEDPELVKELSEAAVKGFQGKDLSKPASVLACAKHFLGDGGTTNGTDQGNTKCDESTLRKIHLAGYISAIKAGVGSIMVSYSSWNGQKMHSNKYLLTDLLKGELGFKGFLVSDWAAIDQLSPDFKKDIEMSINAGLDMVMIPNGSKSKNNYKEFITYLKELVAEGKIPITRIDDAVGRILKVKFDMNLFNHPFADKSLTAKIGSKAHREVARECVRQSLVLLKNDNSTLPVSKRVKKLFVAGKGADNIGMQCGGWTISWQGEMGQVTTGGTTILQAIKNTVSKNTDVKYSLDGSGSEGSDLAVVVVGETPYAEMKGDREELNLSDEDIKLVEKVKQTGIPTVVVLLSGRPMIIDKALLNADAFVAAWLPGTEAEGITDVIFGDYNFAGKLSHSWPKNMEQVPINLNDKNYDPLFKYGFGLKYDHLKAKVLKH